MRGMLWLGELLEAYKLLFLGLVFFGLTLLVMFVYVEHKLIQERHQVEELRITKRKMIQELERRLEELAAAKDKDHQELLARITELEAKLPKGS
jgi:Na+-transporting methylmalonyl-CoA/oxaloacetate decarboxylase gamma subunit